MKEKEDIRAQATPTTRMVAEQWQKMLDRPRVMKGPMLEKDATYHEMLLRRKNVGICCFIENMGSGGKSHHHGHILEAPFYVLEGNGYEIHDGVKFEWQAGDCVIVQPGGCVHQHFNADPERPARALVFHLGTIYYALNLTAGREISEPDGESYEEFEAKDIYREGAGGDI